MPCPTVLLGPQSSGIFIARTAEEWIMGYNDPLVSAKYPPPHPQSVVRAVVKNFPLTDLAGGVSELSIRMGILQ
jgi:hypothetical protein